MVSGTMVSGVGVATSASAATSRSALAATPRTTTSRSVAMPMSRSAWSTTSTEPIRESRIASRRPAAMRRRAA